MEGLLILQVQMNYGEQALDTLDFMPLSADYSGGIIITDWYQ